MADQSHATDVQTCAECGRAVPADAQTFGLCPRCLIQSAVFGGGDGDSGTASPGDFPRDFVAPPPSELAAEFPELEILELLGRGGMGAVYKARQIGLDRLVAVKIFPLDPAAPDAAPGDGSGGSAAGNFAQRFRHEARLLARLSHPNIVTAHQAGQTANYCFFVMEYVPGPNLRDLLRRGPLPPAEAVRIATGVCDALESAHAQGVVHRDVKPENILLQGDAAGRVRVVDFGLGKLLDHRSPWMGMTADGHRLGTPYYMAPEQNKPGAPVDARADIYAVGVLLYEALTGELPVGRFAAPSEKRREAASGGWALDGRLDRIVLRCLEPDPRLRYQRAADLRRDLADVAATPASPAPHATLLPPPAPLGALAYQPTVPDSIHPAYRRRLVMNAAAVGAVATVALLVAGAVVAALAWRARGPGKAPNLAAATQPATQPAAVAAMPQPPPFPRMTQPPWPPGFGPQSPPYRPTFTGPDEWLRRMTEEHGRDRIVTLRIDGLPGDVTSHIRERLHAVAKPPNIYSSGSADSLTVHMAPVGDVQALADKIDFGTVQSVDADKKVIRVKADPRKLPEPLAPVVTDPRDDRFYERNLQDLTSWDAGRRQDAVARLRDAPAPSGPLRASIAKELRRRLKEDSDSRTRAAAATALATWVEPENAAALVEALKDVDWVVRRQVLEALGKLKNPQTAAAVAQMLPQSRHDAAASLKAFGPAAEEALLPYLKHADQWVRMEAARVLGEVGTAKSLPALEELSKSSDGLAPGAAKQAVEAIRKRHGA